MLICNSKERIKYGNFKNRHAKKDESTGDQMGQPELALQILKDTYGEENVEELAGNMARVEGVGVVTLIQKTNPRHHIAAELASLGVRQVEIEKLLKRDKSKGSSGYYSRVLKNPMVKAQTDKHVAEHVAAAKARLNAVVEKSAENIAAAVEGGHLPSSLKVLQMADVINPVQRKEVTKKVLFADWLMGEREESIPVTEYEEGQLIEDPSYQSDKQPIATCADELVDEPTGERLDGELFNGDLNG